MLRYAAIAFLTTAVVSTADATGLPGLAADLERFITDFDLAALDESGLQRVEGIIDDPDASHAQKVLALHTLLDRNGALEHADMHGARNLLTAEMR